MTEAMREALTKRGRKWGETKGTVDRPFRGDEHFITYDRGYGQEFYAFGIAVQVKAPKYWD